MDGEALNRLNRAEWNAAYFLGLEKILRGEATGNLAVQLGAGVLELHEAGYRFESLDLCADGSLRCLGPDEQGEHDRACREILSGTFDQVGRAREAATWLRVTLHHEKARWLHGLLSVYDRAHSAPLPSVRLRDNGAGLASAGC